jgi:ubiquitin-activating enzyme E1
VQTAGFVPKKIKVQLPGEENKNQNEQPEEAAGEEDVDAVNRLVDELKTMTEVQAKDIKVADFEKDDDSNFHIDFINAAANLRARNYKIQECERHKTKMIAGKIIPAIATTTAMITGTVTTEIYKFVQGKNKIGDFKNSFINLALPMFVFSEPDEPKKNTSKDYDPTMLGPIKAIPENWTIWDTLDKKGPLTIKELQESFKASHGIEITLISAGKVCIYNQYLPGQKHAPRLARTVEDVYREISEEPIPEGRHWLPLEFGGEVIGDGCDFSLPTCKYTFA